MDLGLFDLFLVGLCLIGVIGLYFYNNPLGHGGWFLIRRFINWFPLGMTYAFLYMGRYNLTVAKNALGVLMSKEDFGLIFGIGTLVYGLSFLVNGPIVDKIGGKAGIIIAAVGASLANIGMGVVTYLVVMGRLHVNMVLTFSVAYALNMYFQSYGGVSIIKVKAYWFHVRERGVFGAIFGTLISFGVYFAFDWGQAIADMTKSGSTGGWLHTLVQKVFAVDTGVHDASWALFFIPAGILLVWAVLDAWLIKNTPEEANFPHFDTHDASSGVMHVELSTLDLLKKVFGSPLMLLFASVELTAGVLRNGIMQWYTIFAKEVSQPPAGFFVAHWGLLLCYFGIVGGFAGGLISDKYFQSRRGPPAAVLSAFMFLMTIVMSVALYLSLGHNGTASVLNGQNAPVVVGISALLIVMAVTGVHSLMSGTAAADFGGRKATATCSGIVDGCVYLGSGVQSIGVGYLAGHSWQWWPIFLMPFALAGALLAAKFWHALPTATKKYIDEVESKSGGAAAAGTSIH
jgi:OPA family glycerol-3-phosphate transporter-like MFS transporter